MHGQTIVPVREVDAGDIFDAMQSVIEARAMDRQRGGRRLSVTGVIQVALQGLDQMRRDRRVEQLQESGMQRLLTQSVRRKLSQGAIDPRVGPEGLVVEA